VTFEPITTPTADDLANVSRLASVTRNTWGPDANSYGICFDPETGGPRVLIVESKVLRLSVGQPDDQWSIALQANALPTAFIASRDYAPVTLTPETRVSLEPGDVVILPYGSTCGRYGDPQDTPVVFLEITLLPGLVGPPTTHEQLGMTGESLDISFGTATFNEPAPPVVVAGRLHIEAGGTLTLEDLDMPLALLVESGDAMLNAIHDSGLVKSISSPEYHSSGPLASGEDVMLSAGQLLYIPATATGTITSANSIAFLMVSLSFGSA
jgi:hypothetical protein